MGCFAMTETGHGSNVQALGTDRDVRRRDRRVRDHHARRRRRARTTSATPREHADVGGRLRPARGRRRGPRRARVRRADPRRRRRRRCPASASRTTGRKIGLNGVDNGRIWFDGVRVPRDSLLNRYADVTEDGRYVERRSRTRTGASSRCSARWCRAGSASAAPASTPARSRWRIAVALRRTRAGSSRRPSPDEEELLLDYGHAPAPAAPAAGARPTRCTSRRRSWRGELHDVFSATPTRRRRAGAGASWSRARPAPRRSAPGTPPGRSRSAARRAAAPATSRSTGSPRCKADTDVFTTFEGDNHVLLQLVAKGLLTDYASDFEDLDQLGMVRFVAGLARRDRDRAHRARTSCSSGSSDVLPGGDDGWDQEAGLLDPDYQLAMLRFREEHMLAGRRAPAQARHRRRAEPRRGVLAACQDHVIARRPRPRRAAGARGVRRQGRDAAGRRPQGRARACCATCYALSTHRGATGPGSWSTAGSPSARSKAITREVNDLCRKVRPLAVDLVDAFGVPAELLRSPDLL